jgi:hypothetical protein
MQTQVAEQQSGAATCGKTRRATRQDAAQSAAAAQMRCREFGSASVVGRVQLERGAASGVQVQAQAPGDRAGARHAGWRGAAPTEVRRQSGKRWPYSNEPLLMSEGRCMYA